MTSQVDRRFELVRRFYTAGPSEDDALRVEFASPSIVWHAPGENRVSGDYRGFDAVFGELPSKMQPLDEWSVELVEVMGNGDLVVAVVRVRARRGDRRVDCAGAHVFRFGTGDLIEEAWGFVADQTALDVLFDS